MATFNGEPFAAIYARHGSNAQRTADYLGVAVSTLKGWDCYREIRHQILKAKEEYSPRILFLDIETRPATAFVWGLRDQNIALNQIVDPGGTLCFGAKWKGEKEMLFYSDWQHGHEEMICQAHQLFTEADAVVTYNGDRFDIPKLWGEFAQADLPPPPQPTSIDVYKAVKKLGLLSNKLAFVGPLFTDEGKLKHEGMELWTKVLAGDEKAQRKMEGYCSQDVLLLEKVYDRVKAYIPNHPHMGLSGSQSCGACGSRNLRLEGHRRTKAFRIERVQCADCGSWQTGKRIKLAA